MHGCVRRIIIKRDLRYVIITMELLSLPLGALTVMSFLFKRERRDFIIDMIKANFIGMKKGVKGYCKMWALVLYLGCKDSIPVTEKY